jgi:hypothetical protein
MKYLVLLMFVIPQVCFANDNVIYYVGTEVHTSLFGQPQTKSDLLVIKKSIREKNKLIEIACSKKPKEKAKLFPVYMEIQGNAISKISENPNYSSGALDGKGTLTGTEWSWHYLTFSMTYKMENGVSRIEDENWVAGDHLIAIKEVFWKGNDGSPEMLVELITAKTKAVEKAAFETKWKALGCAKPPSI